MRLQAHLAARASLGQQQQVAWVSPHLLPVYQLNVGCHQPTVWLGGKVLLHKADWQGHVDGLASCAGVHAAFQQLDVQQQGACRSRAQQTGLRHCFARQGRCSRGCSAGTSAGSFSKGWVAAQGGVSQGCCDAPAGSACVPVSTASTHLCWLPPCWPCCNRTHKCSPGTNSCCVRSSGLRGAQKDAKWQEGVLGLYQWR